MTLIERLSKEIAEKTARTLNLDKDREEVIAYGALNFLHTMLTTILLILFGFIAGSLAEVLLIGFTSAAVRKYAGGMHANSPTHCALISLILFGGMTLLVKFMPVFTRPYFVLVFQILIALAALILFYKLSPVDSPNKRITNPEKRKKLRNGSIILLLFLQFITLAFWTWHLRTGSLLSLRLIACISAGLAWQTVSLTAAGRFIIDRLMLLLSKIGI
ncbi:MAG: accessory gene regulator ArgB-like protein [Caldicoprobacterales bacterium]|jgi:accessory gene regulator B